MQTSTRPLIAEIDQLRRSVDSMNSQTAEMIRSLDNLRQTGADHIALPSSEQEKLDREWEYFETVCDQVFFILENAKYKLKRQQDVLHQQLNPPPTPPPQEKPSSELNQAATMASSAIVNTATDINTNLPITTISSGTTPSSSLPSSTAPITVASTFQDTIDISPSASAAISMPVPPESSAFDLEMMSPPTNFDINTSSDMISTASLLSGGPIMGNNVVGLNGVDNSIMDDNLVSEEDKLQDTMLDLGDIGNLGDLGDMDDMINF
ncbi:hypothetical protein BGZ99_006295 [Dissophora globulifera]|uniref:Uncharacterized protein n=1 Tax=Dissophora globulifera TaxID=979702 RepID=A0A9P6USA8_9FUNG|nr:hypothetical protein BGZ99_006295 [Dissophora globulifera]